MLISEEELGKRLALRDSMLPLERLMLDNRLFDAAENGRGYDALDYLRQGADPKARNDKGQTPLMVLLLAPKGYHQTARVLMENGADPHADHNGETPFTMAIFTGRIAFLNAISYTGSVTAQMKREMYSMLERKGMPPGRECANTRVWVAYHILL